ncbi:MAG TPA: hypothetical protein VEL73_07025, partial [Mycobacteriales bacterium]|nr:hypothetical protein [Mycobacteriales bacterium]
DAARERRRRRQLRTTTGAVAAAVAVLAAGASVTALVRNAGSHNSAVSAGSAASASYDGRAAGPAKQAPQAQPNASAATAGIPSYSRETLRGSLAAIERESTLAATSKLGETGPAGAMADAARRQACAQTIVGHPGELRAVRRISYEGVPSYLFVFDDGQPHGYVVDLQCGTSGGLPATILDRVP